jgi:hypothetical protein
MIADFFDRRGLYQDVRAAQILSTRMTIMAIAAHLQEHRLKKNPANTNLCSN